MIPLDRTSIASLNGYLSLGFWILVYSPQIYENYQMGSGEGLSVWFIFIWLAGDMSNLLGAFWQKLLPTVVYLAAYYVFCDVVLLGQVAYYRRRRQLHPEEYLDPSLLKTRRTDVENGSDEEEDPTERTALLAAASESKIHLIAASAKSKSSRFFAKHRDAILFAISFILVLIIGVSGWLISQSRRSRGDHGSPPTGQDDEEIWEDKAQLVGWLSAVLYLSSRFPQIIKNMETKCEGLSLVFFTFAMLGNLTFCASILIVSLSFQHIMINLSWLVGSFGTVLLDCIVISQFAWYRKDRKRIHEQLDAVFVQ